jgi:hypothetical protein
MDDQTMDQTTLSDIVSKTRQHLAADPTHGLAASGMASPLALLALRVLEAMHAHEDWDEVIDLIDDLLSDPEHRKALRRTLRGDPAAALRSLDADPPLRAACQALVAALDGGSEGEGRTVQQVSASTATNVRQIVADTYMEAPVPPADDQPQHALLTYLAGMVSECNALALGTLTATDAAHRRPLELSQVYISLNTTTQVRVSGDGEQGTGDRGQEETRLLPALEALAHTPSCRLMLLGAPGSGKTTFVNHLASSLAAAKRSLLQGQNAAAVETTLAETLPGWTLGALLPVRVILRDFAAFASSATSTKNRLLLDFLRQTLDEHGCAEAFPLIQRHLQTGEVLLLLDGLDEVVGAGVLERVAESITAVAHSCRDTPLLITCPCLVTRRSLNSQQNGFCSIAFEKNIWKLVCPNL